MVVTMNWDRFIVIFTKFNAKDMNSATVHVSICCFYALSILVHQLCKH